MNLVIMPLEGVSQTLFWQYREAMPTLWRMSLRSAMFRRFYTASTSAFQSFVDFAHGDSTQLDHNRVFPSRGGCLAASAANFFDILRRRGYEVLGLQHGGHCPHYVQHDYYGAWPESCGKILWHDGYAPFYREIEHFLERRAADGKPFVLHCNDRAALLGDDSEEKRGEKLFHSRIEKGFSLLDGSVRLVMEKLSAAGLTGSTIVVAYGPYGTDPWKHGIYLGRTHAMDPYADLCWTPLIIYNNDNDICTADQLVSVIDLKHTLLHMLFPQEPAAQPTSILTGVDILSFNRQAAFTQNLFALEKENTGPSQGLVKSYAVTDGDQRLIVSSDGGIPGEGGMELYYDPRDPANTRNFLDFFQLDQNGIMTSFGRRDIIHPHFTMSFKPNLVMSVANSYNTMREQLFSFIKLKEGEALKRAGTEAGADLFPEDSFRRKRKRK